VSTQDLCQKQGFTRLPGYNFWIPDLGLITEDDYKPSTREAYQVGTIELARHAICAASSSIEKACEAMQDLQDVPTEIEEALFEIVDSLSSAHEILSVTKILSLRLGMLFPSPRNVSRMLRESFLRLRTLFPRSRVSYSLLWMGFRVPSVFFRAL
jgi:hypothetical protein